MVPTTGVRVVIMCGMWIRGMAIACIIWVRKIPIGAATAIASTATRLFRHQRRRQPAYAGSNAVLPWTLWRLPLHVFVVAIGGTSASTSTGRRRRRLARRILHQMGHRHVLDPAASCGGCRDGREDDDNSEISSPVASVPLRRRRAPLVEDIVVILFGEQ